MITYPATPPPMAVIARPAWIRVPSSRRGDRCPWTGLTRFPMLRLILPTKDRPNPPVESKLLKSRPDAKGGCRLVNLASLEAYINGQGSEPRPLPWLKKTSSEPTPQPPAPMASPTAAA